jgi:hypothetical protein
LSPPRPRGPPGPPPAWFLEWNWADGLRLIGWVCDGEADTR